jgi:hypothetical protein
MTDSTKMAKQMIEFYKTTFDNSFSAMMTLREQMERMTNSYKKNCEDFKKVVDDGFKNLESLSA